MDGPKQHHLFMEDTPLACKQTHEVRRLTLTARAHGIRRTLAAVLP